MTNNPTIDGVSRELLANLHKIASRKCKSAWSAGVCDELRALLDAPAVERQELKPAVRVCGAGYDAERNTVWMETGVVEMPIMRKVEVGEELVFLSEAQSTIARLEARIAELESGRGEPVAWMYKREGGEVLGQLVQMESDDLKGIRLGKCYDDGTRYMWPREDYIEWKPLYASPPAPVAVVPEKYDDVLLPFLGLMRAELHANAHKGDRPGWLQMDRKTAILEVFYHMGKLHQAVHRNEVSAIKEYAADVANMCMMLLDVCACLDATAALNGPAK